MTPDSEPGIVAAIVVQERRVLLVRRRQSEGTLSWQFPAGQVENGETARRAAAREVAEETGLTVEPADVLGKRLHPITGRHLTYVTCTVVSGEASVVDTDELDQIAWCGIDQLRQLIPTGIHEPVLAHLRRVLC